MSIGLIVLDDSVSLVDALEVLNSNTSDLLQKCQSYIIYTTYSSSDVWSGLKNNTAICDKIYDVTNSDSFLGEGVRHFKLLVKVLPRLLQISENH